MMKYRIRLGNGRVIGPFEKRQLFELKTKGHIKGDEEAQVFPTGNWEALSSFDFYPDLMDDEKTILNQSSTKDETFVINLEQLRLQKSEKELEELENSTKAPVEPMTETIRLSQTDALGNFPKITPQTEQTSSSKGFDIDISEEENTSGDRTLINPVAQEEIERMRREKEAERKNEELLLTLNKQKEEEAKKLEEIKAKELIAVSPNEATQVIRLDKVGLLEAAKENEQDIEQELIQYKKRKAKEEKEEEGEDEEEDVGQGSKKKKIILVVAALAMAYAFLFPDEKNQKPVFKNIEPQIVFPIPFDVSDVTKSKVALKKGLELHNKGNYPLLIKSGLSFKESYENDLDNNEALSFLVRTYAEELRYSSKKASDAQTLFNIIQSKRPLLLQNANGVIGLNLFYMAINKNDAAIDVVQKYLKLKPQEVTQDLFAVYLQSLIKRGKIDLAKQFYTALEKAPEKSRYNYSALIEYYLLNQELERAMELIDEAIKKYPHLVEFNLKKAELLLKHNKYLDALPFLKKVEEKNYDHNNKNRAKYFELKGLILAYDKKPKEATAYLTRSLKLEDSTTLRSALASLETTNGLSIETDQLINESKAVKFLLDAQGFYERKNYELALSYAAKATDALPGHIPSELFLSQVQLKLGLTSQGLKTLENLNKKYPEDKKITLALIEAYIDTYKFNDAQNRIQNISNPEIRDSGEYASVNAKLHLKMGDTLQAMSWLKNSMSINPLNDHDIFLLADILIRKANYDAARTLLNKCMELDPVNPDYRLAYARLIYETQDDMAAIGYLLSLKDDLGEQPKILSELAIFYFRAGKVKDFLEQKEKLEKNHASDKSLYEFLIKAALMDDRTKDIPALVEKLLVLEPGDLEQMMTAGRVLFEEGQLVEAAKWFKRIQDKLPTYPRVLYYLAKIDFMAGNPDLALQKIEQNMKENGENDADLVLMGQIKVAKGELVDAENIFKKAQKLNNKSYDAIVGLADLSTKRNNHDLALDLYKRALKIRSDEPEVYRKMGDVYRQLSQGTLAIEAYKMYLEMAPESTHKRNLEAYIQLMK